MNYQEKSESYLEREDAIIGLVKRTVTQIDFVHSLSYESPIIIETLQPYIHRITISFDGMVQIDVLLSPHTENEVRETYHVSVRKISEASTPWRHDLSKEKIALWTQWSPWSSKLFK